MMRQLAAVAIGGAAGAVMRWLMASAVQRLAGGAFPWGTFAVNALGSFLLGFLFVWLIERSTASELLRLAITVGFLGAFTTFSTYSLESVRLLQEGAMQMAFANIVGQVVVCLSLTWLGVQCARWL
ncbi:MAG: fluoride efflux transporter CrcB [Zetaproteobacteria bacterium CG12_big_fil_rev_8_21_14_0_65_54_13]|nr:MAG: fluoride efflux transporter CrcB [Zetaproteobacteria bacterium CG23_combo_of_CG06-09_8_20_14_all_54_7]PIW47569.1 MAG: fluoride efflux transporter CrcB [Zetaproteobacteria bacterium CG12_big_fil_rev_8_21_14_0_65_54_13]PIX53924.1 MAG: fluoride efflux transporter CrcB [Zetaproteobacteria bacterium CG_4_10_14_3_um_filter_54_28]PJA30093.1 MAG: fluoride efflux transporter CrcB [Zetaproteobacteria bacterium CG_4_9_14_3_um_filter_54_145]